MCDEASTARLLVLELEAPPFFVLWSPSGETLTYLANDADGLVQLIEVDLAAARAVEGAAGATATAAVVDRGRPLFYSFAAPDGGRGAATLVVHNGERTGVRRRAETGLWQDVSSAPGAFMAPHCFTPPGSADDAVLLAEGGQLVVTSLDGQARRALCRLKGFATTAVAPDGRRAAVMQTDPANRRYSVGILEDAQNGLTPHAQAAPTYASLPFEKPVLCFSWSPDSTKLLCLVSDGTAPAAAPAAGRRKQRPAAKARWHVYDVELGTVTRFASVVPRPYFSKVYLPFFDQYALSGTAWSPASDAFSYTGANGAWVQRLPEPCSGADADEEGCDVISRMRTAAPPLPSRLADSAEVVSWSWN